MSDTQTVAINPQTLERIRAREAEILGKPPRVETVDRMARADEIIEATDRLRASLFGNVPSLSIEQVPQIMVTMMPFGTLWERIMGLSMTVMGPASRLAKRDQKLAILRTGWLLQAPYEFGEHVHQSKALGMTSEEIERITSEGSASPLWSDHERAILRCAEQLHANAAVDDETWEVLSRSLDAQQIFELIVLIGQFTLVAYFQNALRLPLEAGNPGLAAR
ncbi:alkylhydroperoxidase family enzyme [Novosphingobium sp. PhB165]|uniref:carboxymuconolactone decarboxylase family protein n=1 Tax=Novosphingobium sp. PhB165 TaxID=2485105 RepID=UPI0010435B22|nr:carboxymuconolactone decarboxylase family protein [Novosphingobium sp. PhB165]TCM20724.1 alkylhydroperoxidase family enzyme [Novosphingobium sp. PhB165]